MQRIAYFGPSGTFTEAALEQMIECGVVAAAVAGRDGRSGRLDVEAVPADSPAATLAAVLAGEAAWACVPIESSIEGPVLPTLDPLATGSRLQIFGETELDIAFAIVARPGLAAADVRTVAAYPVAAAQVRTWLGENLPGAQVTPAGSNADAAARVAAGEADAAVATAIAGRRLGLDFLAENVIDVEGARTRFVLVGPPAPVPGRTGSDRTGVVLWLANRPGSLGEALGQFSMRGIDLTRIASRPTRSALGEYYFQLDCAGHIDDPSVAETLTELHRTCRDVRFLGSWPVAHAEGAAPPARTEAEQWLKAMRKGDPL